MEWLLAILIKKKVKTYDEVPERYKDGVKNYLILWGIWLDEYENPNNDSDNSDNEINNDNQEQQEEE